MEEWAELRHEHFVRGVSIKELARRTGLSRNTVRAALRSSTPPRYRRERSGSKLDPFKDEIHRLLKDDPDLPGQRVRKLIATLGFGGGKTIVDDYLREARSLFRVPRTYQRTVSNYAARSRRRIRLVPDDAQSLGDARGVGRGWRVVALRMSENPPARRRL